MIQRKYILISNKYRQKYRHFPPAAQKKVFLRSGCSYNYEMVICVTNRTSSIIENNSSIGSPPLEVGEPLQALRDRHVLFFYQRLADLLMI